MGSQQGEENERPQHQVTIGRPFYVSQTTVTQREWKDLMGSEPWKGDSHVREGDGYPAVNVSWYDAQEFLNRLSSVDRSNSYYLPTEDARDA